MGRVRWLWIALLFALGLPAHADPAGYSSSSSPPNLSVSGNDERIWFSTFYASQWISTSLPQIPYAGVTGSLRTAPTYFAGLGIGRTLIPSFNIPLPFCSCGINGFRLEAEGQFVKHFGLESESEIAGAFVFRTPQIPLFLGVSVDGAVGEGLSYDLTLPSFEGSVAAYGPRAPGPSHLLNFMIYEFEFTQERWKDLHFVLQIHHRSGIWGVIAPKGSGGNYLGVGLRADFM